MLLLWHVKCVDAGGEVCCVLLMFECLRCVDVCCSVGDVRCVAVCCSLEV